jgi:very-short-patch-repair endonuclease
VTSTQLRELGYGPEAIKHRLKTGRLHTIWRGVYAVGRPQLTREGRLTAAVLACGAGAALSHGSAAALWGIWPARGDLIEVTVPWPRRAKRRGILVRRRSHDDITRRAGIPVTRVVRTLIEIATRASTGELEAAINDADKLDLIRADRLRVAIDDHVHVPGAGRLRRVLDRHTFVLTESELERRLLPLAARAGLGKPQTGVWLNGFKVDFYWPDLGLVVESDGLRYHRTPAQQARDRLRDQAHAAAGLTTLRFSHAQVAFDPWHIERTLRAVAERLLRTAESLRNSAARSIT